MTGTDVNSVVTSKDVIHLPGPNVLFLIDSMKLCVLCMLCCDLSTSDGRMLFNSFAILYVTESLLEIMGLRGCHFL